MRTLNDDDWNSKIDWLVKLSLSAMCSCSLCKVRKRWRCVKRMQRSNKSWELITVVNWIFRTDLDLRDQLTSYWSFWPFFVAHIGDAWCMADDAILVSTQTLIKTCSKPISISQRWVNQTLLSRLESESNYVLCSMCIKSASELCLTDVDAQPNLMINLESSFAFHIPFSHSS